MQLPINFEALTVARAIGQDAAQLATDRAERDARRAGEDSVSADRVARAKESLRVGEAA
jgi:hypothetical protein